jgi:hypothetical protein
MSWRGRRGGWLRSVYLGAPEALGHHSIGARAPTGQLAHSLRRERSAISRTTPTRRSGAGERLGALLGRSRHTGAVTNAVAYRALLRVMVVGGVVLVASAVGSAIVLAGPASSVACLSDSGPVSADRVELRLWPLGPECFFDGWSTPDGDVEPFSWEPSWVWVQAVVSGLVLAVWGAVAIWRNRRGGSQPAALRTEFPPTGPGVSEPRRTGFTTEPPRSRAS